MDITLGEEKTITSWRDAVLHVSGLAQARLPDSLHGAVQRATALVLHRHVWLDDDGRHAQVLSSDGKTWYVVNGTCTCLGAPQAPQGLCKHRLGVQIYRRASELLTSSPARVQPPSADTTCPEALFSACLRGTVKGIETQLTARGQTLEEFQRNFDAVHALFDVPAARPASETTAPPSTGTPTCPHHGPGKESTKAPGTWYCTKKMADGSYCRWRSPEK